MFWIFTITGLIVSAIAVETVYRSVISSRICELIDNVPPFGVVESEPVDSAEVFQVETRDGLKLTASLHGDVDAARGLILFCPELHGSHWAVSNYGLGLIEGGFAVLSFDVRNQGESEHQADMQPCHWPTELELSDLKTVLQYISDDDRLNRMPLGVYGISRGGSMALVAACRSQRIQSVVVDSAYDTMTMVHHFMDKFSRYVVPDWFFRRLPAWHIDIVLRQALRKSERKAQRTYLRLANEADAFSQPALLISGSRDSYVTPEVTARLAAMLGCDDNVWIVPKAKHNKARSVQTAEYDNRVVSHFETTLAPRQTIGDSRPPAKSTIVEREQEEDDWQVADATETR